MKKTLLGLSQFAIFFMGLFGGFLTRIAPPEDAARFWTGFATLLVGFIFLLIKIESRSLDSPARISRFSRVVFVALGTAVVSFVTYQWFYQTRTVPYAGRVSVIGSQLTTYGEQVKQAKRLSNGELLESNAGNPQGIWTEESIVGSRMLLGCLYAASVGLAALVLITGCEIVKDAV